MTRPLSYTVFLGEFSGYWVGIARAHGEIVHSVQRETPELADRAVRDRKSTFTSIRSPLQWPHSRYAK